MMIIIFAIMKFAVSNLIFFSTAPFYSFYKITDSLLPDINLYVNFVELLLFSKLLL